MERDLLGILKFGKKDKSELLTQEQARLLSEREILRKSEVMKCFKKLAKHLGVSQKVISKSPTAGLWEGQTDEGEFGFSYVLADKILYLYAEKKLSKTEIIAKGYDKKVVERLWWWIEKGEFKDRLPHTR